MAAWPRRCPDVDSARWPRSHPIPGMLNVFDLPDLYRELDARCDFKAVDFLDGILRPVSNPDSTEV